MSDSVLSQPTPCKTKQLSVGGGD